MKRHDRTTFGSGFMSRRRQHASSIAGSSSENATPPNSWLGTSPKRSRHPIEDRLACIVEGVRIVGFDNERGQGEHRHDDGVESADLFRPVEALVADVITAVQAWRRTHGRD